MLIIVFRRPSLYIKLPFALSLDALYDVMPNAVFYFKARYGRSHKLISQSIARTRFPHG